MRDIKRKKVEKTTEIPELLTLLEAGELLKVHVNTLRAWDRKSMLVAVRLGERRLMRYRKKDIIKLLDQRKLI